VLRAVEVQLGEQPERPAVVPAERILDEAGALVESAQAERAEVDIPFAVVDLDESDVLLAQGLTDVDPLRKSLGGLVTTATT
jgi:hypothetical protein